MFELAEQVIEVSQSKSKIVLIPYSEAFGAGFEDMQRRLPDIRKIDNLLGWKPTMSLRQILVGVRDSFLTENKKGPL
jgi:UDP-glucose 4-epimerase